ncbi:MAG: acyl-CoA dehydrogenase, partial [Pseudomonadota bacterium]
MNFPADDYQDIREGVRALCEKFPPEYHRKVDMEKSYPEA